MSFTIPPAKNYASPLVAVPTNYGDVPPEGAHLINCEILWGTMSSVADRCVNINLQNNATMNFSQISALSVDNSQCSTDIVFVFPDTGETTTFPAYSPKTILEVFTHQTQFFVVAKGALATDVSRFSIHNTVPPPIAVPISVEQQVAAANNITADGATGAQVIPMTINGTIEAISVSRTGPIASANNQSFSIVDGALQVIAVGTFSSQAPQTVNVLLLNLTDIHVRFSGGLQFLQAGTNVGGFYAVNIYYRNP